MQSLSGQKRTEFARHAVNFDWLMKNKLVDSTHLNNSEKLCRIIYGADKIHIPPVSQTRLKPSPRLKSKSEVFQLK